MKALFLADKAFTAIGDWQVAAQRLGTFPVVQTYMVKRGITAGDLPGILADNRGRQRLLADSFGGYLEGRAKTDSDLQLFLELVLGDKAAKIVLSGPGDQLIEWSAAIAVPDTVRGMTSGELRVWAERFLNEGGPSLIETSAAPPPPKTLIRFETESDDQWRGPRERVVERSPSDTPGNRPDTRTDRVSGRDDDATDFDALVQMTFGSDEAATRSEPPPTANDDAPPDSDSGDPAAPDGRPPRYTDVVLADELGTKMPPDTASVVAGEPFELQIAIRGGERLEGLKTKPGTEREAAKDPGVAAELLVVATDDDGVFTIHDRWKTFRLPLDGDSDTATIRVTAKAIDKQQRANITLRIYRELDLVDHLTLCIAVRAMPDEEWPAGDTPPSYIDPTLRPKTPRIRGLTARTLGGLDRTLNIAIQDAKDGHRLVVVARDKDKPNELVYAVHESFVGDAEVQDWLTRMRTVLLKEVSDVATRSKDSAEWGVSEPTGLEVIRELAKLGRAALVTMGMGSTTDEDNLAKLLAKLAPAEGETIQICLLEGARKFVFPWQLVSTTAAGDKPKPTDLWGYRYVLEVREDNPLRPADGGTTPDSQIACFAWAAFANWPAHRKALEDLVVATAPGAVGLKITDTFGSKKVWQETLSSAQARLFYLYGHGESAVGAPVSPVMSADGKVGAPARDSVRAEGIFVTVDEMVGAMLDAGKEVKFRKDAIVFLNACETAEMLSGKASTFVPVFLRSGAAAVLGTEATMPIAATAPFGQTVIQHLLAKRSIGEAVRAARIELWDKFKSPLGLAYSLYGDAAARLLDDPQPTPLQATGDPNAP